MKLPIPTHLQNILIPIGESNSEREVTGKIRCTCGGEAFALRESNGRQIVNAVCKACGREHLLFDQGKHGWDGFVCGADFLDREQPLQPYPCPECKKESFGIVMRISSEGEQDFAEELLSHDGSFAREDWVNAFAWITVSLSCEECGHTDSEWLDLETM